MSSDRERLANIEVSLFCSAIRPNLWKQFLDSLAGTTCSFEVVFSGYCSKEEVEPFLKEYPFFKYIHTGRIKPAQNYHVSLKNCKGEIVLWICDDAEMPNDVLGKAYRFYKANCTRKDVVCIQTRENYGSWQVCDITQHKFFAASAKAPKMAPIGMINREYFQELGGIDRRYVSGQWDNDLLVRVYGDGGKLYHFSEATIDLDHLNKHDKRWGVSGERPFGQGYAHDRNILEGSWGKRGQMKYEEFPNFTRYDGGFEPYTFTDEELLVKSESYNLKELFSE